MGEPAVPTKTDREDTRDLAAKIVASVCDDARMPLPLEIVPIHGAGEHFRRADVESFVFQLAQEITLLLKMRDALAALKTRTLLSAPGARAEFSPATAASIASLCEDALENV